MAFAERAELIARLSLKDEFSRPLAGAQSKLSGFGRAAGTAGKAIGVGLAAGAVVATAAISRAVKGGLQSLAELESATTSVDAAIKQMGLTGQVTSRQIAGWASEIEKDVGSAFDDKAITQAATTLIRFGKIATSNLQPALVVMTDLATKTGSVESAASLLAKALADPEKAAGKLARSGVILTKVEQDQIKAMVKAGDAAGAQKVLLDALAKATKGAAAASQGPYQRSLSTLRDVIEDAERALAEGFLPVIEKVRDILSEELAKPQTLANIREFGKGLAGGLDSLVEVARKIPWGSIGDALKLGGAGAKIILDAFTSMPPWVQTAIATGWGLNKLTGGAVTGLIGQLASGLIKGVLGVNAGVVNINAGVVNGAGGLPGAAGGAAGVAKTGLSTLSKVFLVGEAIGLVAAVAGVAQAVSDSSLKQSQDIHQTLTDSLAGPQSVAQLQQKLAGIDSGIKQLKADPIAAALITGPTIAELEKMRGEVVDRLHTVALNTSGSPTERDEAAHAAKTQAAIHANQVAIAAAQHVARDDIVGAVHNGTTRTVNAIHNNRPIVNLSVRVSGDTVRVTKNYQSGSTIGKPGHSKTGGQQEFN